ncbi:12309_t:CDS:2 [Funneliformis geosporum]|uniref:Ubiquinone biosynthesis protein n=1 Tax=Funneliformis geosporum TaxID=1117311 RepID=A0A9W4SEU4_9GLOM|nr:12309_t:CDS:2 [Funneliformis geosporum]
MSRSIFRRNTSCIYQRRMMQPMTWRSILNKQQYNQNFASAANYGIESNSKFVDEQPPIQTSTPPPTPPTPPNPVPSEILGASLPFVNQYGWTIDTLAQGAKASGYPYVSHGLFPRGGAELIDYFLDDCRRKMTHEIFDKMDNLKVHQKIRFACVTRLNYTKPYIKRWPEALAIMAQPNNVIRSVEHLARLVDDMWYLAGDKSADVNSYYQLYMVQDTSPDFIGTFQFLDRRLKDSATFGRIVGDVNNYVNVAVRSAIGILSSKGIGKF